jgi:hypothetical protein
MTFFGRKISFWAEIDSILLVFRLTEADLPRIKEALRPLAPPESIEDRIGRLENRLMALEDR